MPEENAPLEELLEAAEAAVGPRQPPIRTVVIAAVTMASLLTVVAVTLGIASGGQLGREARLLELVAPSHFTPEAYRSRTRLEDTRATFHKTPFGTQEIHLTGTLHNRGDRVLSRASLIVTLNHVFRDETYRYTFEPVTSGVEGIGQPGPLLARNTRDFAYRIPDFPGDVTERDVRVHWAVDAIQFHEGLPIPVALPQPAS